MGVSAEKAESQGSPSTLDEWWKENVEELLNNVHDGNKPESKENHA